LSLFNELKRRNVFKVAIAYLVMAWLVLQVADVVLGHTTAPAWIFQVLMLFLAIGLPFVVFFAWAFELTPEGLKRESEVDRAASITHVTSKRLDYVIIAMLAVAIGVVVADRFLPVGTRLARDQSTQDAAPDNRAQSALLQQEAERAPTFATDDKSIAVLPFVNMSSDAEQEYFSDGLSEELLNLLARIPNLRVIARTSSFAFKGEKIEIAEIAKKLKVAHVLEGSVRKSGNQVRITAQLIRAIDSSHLWSESYDRTLDDVFAIQDEISAAVVEQLKITLLGAAPKAKEIDPAAYVLALQARQVLRQSTAEGFEESIVLFQQALAIAPDYAAAWAGLSQSYSSQADMGTRPAKEGFTLAREAADKVLTIDPSNAVAHAQLGLIAMSYDGDLAAAAHHLDRALQLAPANLDVILNAATLTVILGRAREAVALAEYVVSRDPLNPQGQSNAGSLHFRAKQWDDAIASMRIALSLSPGIFYAQYSIGNALLQKGEPDAALAAMLQESSAAFRLIGLVMAYHALGQAAQSDAALAELIDTYEKVTAYNIAYVLAYRGEADRAFEWLDKAVQYKDSGLPYISTQIEFTNIQDDPRWLPFLESIGKSPAQLDAIEFKVNLPE
jgi:TolB-like protein